MYYLQPKLRIQKSHQLAKSIDLADYIFQISGLNMPKNETVYQLGFNGNLYYLNTISGLLFEFITQNINTRAELIIRLHTILGISISASTSYTDYFLKTMESLNLIIRK
jgi:hypothetical protein